MYNPGIFISGRNPFHNATPPPSSAPAEWSEWWLLCVCGWHRHRGPVFHPLHRIALHLWAPPFTTVTFAFCPQWALYAQHCWRQRGAAYRPTEELKMPLQRCLATRLYATLLWFQSALMGKLGPWCLFQIDTLEMKHCFSFAHQHLKLRKKTPNIDQLGSIES